MEELLWLLHQSGESSNRDPRISAVIEKIRPNILQGSFGHLSCQNKVNVPCLTIFEVHKWKEDRRGLIPIQKKDLFLGCLWNKAPEELLFR